MSLRALPSPIRVAVVGVGYLGKFHARKYALRPEAKLVAVSDTNPETARRIAQENQCEAVGDFRDLIGRVDAVSVVVPTQAHAAVAEPLLEAGIHCLVEKPFASTLEEAERLSALAARKGVVLQVGHLERFNPVWTACRPLMRSPLFIEAHRLAGFTERGLDVDVVMDLMIHDLDLCLSLFADRPLTLVHAVGVPVLSPSIDIANARLVFEGGAVANLTASRVSVEPIRKFRVFQPDAYLSLDLQARTADIVRMETDAENGQKRLSGQRVHKDEKADALESEIADFLGAVAGRHPVSVGPESGLAAMRLADQLRRQISSNPDLQRLLGQRG